MPDTREGAGNGPGGSGPAWERSRGGSGPILNAPPIVVVTVLVLIGIQVGIWFGGQDWQVWAIYAFALIPARFQGVQAIAMMEGSQYWSLITYAFLHDGWAHVLFNSIWLLIFGTPVARHFGTLRFLVISLVSTLAGAVVMLAVFWGKDVIVVGASAAVSGLIAAAIPVMFGRPGSPLTFGEFLRDRRAVIFTVVFLVMTLATGVQGLPGFADAGYIAWEAHLGGFAAGLLVYFLLSREGVRSA